MKKILLLTAIIVALCSCTENQRARRFGGDMTVYLPFNEKFGSVKFLNMCVVNFL